MSTSSLVNTIFRGFSRSIHKKQDGSNLKSLQPPQQIFDQIYHIENQQKSLEMQDITHQQHKILGKTIDIIGIPVAQNEEISMKNLETLSELCFKTQNNEVSLIGVDPSYHISDKRSIQKQMRKQILYKGQDVDQETILNENPTYPQHLDEILLDLLPLDFYKGSEQEKMTIIQKIVEKSEEMRTVGYFTSLFVNENVDMSSDASQQKLKELYEIVSERIFGKQEIETYMYPHLKEAALLNIMSGKQIYLGQVPKIYQRLYMANSIDLEYLKQMFKEVLKFSQNYKIKSTSEFGKISPMIFSHIYSFINDYYMYYILQQILATKECQTGATVLIKSHQVDPLKTLLLHYGEKGFKKNEEIIDFMSIPENDQDNDEILLEKHAILDVIFSDLLWEKSYIRNPFPYLQEDYQKLGVKDRQQISQAYSVNVRKYQSVAKEFLKNNQ
ncbi:hypothetical protein ABPG72_020264 [Tetrahymena utriculariae]